MADTVIENLIAKLSFDFDEDKLEEFQDGVETAAKGLIAIVAAAGAAATAIFAFTRKIAEANDELGKFAQRVGIDVEALQELGYVAELNGGSIDSMNSSLANLSRIASEAARGMGAGVEVFGMLGLSVTYANGQLKDADDLLLDVSDAISRLGSQAEKLEFAQKLGINEDLLLAIQQGSEAIKKQRQEARELGFVIDVDATSAAADFQDEMLRLNKIILGVSNAIGTRLMKQLEPMIELFVEWFKVNKALIQQNISQFLDSLLKVLRGVFNITIRVVGMINSLAQAMGGWKNTIIIVTGLLLAMNASALLMPILAVAAGAGILLILEDIITFAEGGDSAIGNLAKKFPLLQISLEALLEVLKLIREGWTLIFTQGDEALEGFIMLIQDIGKAIQTFIIDKINSAIGLINKIPGINVGTVGNSAAATGQARSGAGSIQNSATTNNTTNNPNIVINVNGGDTDKIKQVISDTLNTQYSGAQSNLKSQVEF